MNFVSKYFDELTTAELYEILKARAAIFVLEQNCLYQDLDDKDYYSLHVFYEEKIIFENCKKDEGHSKTHYVSTENMLKAKRVWCELVSYY